MIRLTDHLQVSGDRTERVTPVPIPNTEVKPLRADGTARATAWETRSLPGLKEKASRKAGLFQLALNKTANGTVLNTSEIFSFASTRSPVSTFTHSRGAASSIST